MGVSNAVHIYLTLVSSAELSGEVTEEVADALARAWHRMTPAEREEAQRRLRLSRAEAARFSDVPTAPSRPLHRFSLLPGHDTDDDSET